MNLDDTFSSYDDKWEIYLNDFGGGSLRSYRNGEVFEEISFDNIIDLHEFIEQVVYEAGGGFKNCPLCNTKVSAMSRGGEHIIVCEGCGLSLKHKELAKLLAMWNVRVQ